MKRSIHGLLCFLSIVILLASCNKKELDEFYGKPANLAPPIYDQLQAKGLTSMMAVIDKAGYKDILGKAGYWTLFAPNNEAFTKFLQERNLSSINDLDKETALKIVRYNTLYNAYRRDNISTFESPELILEPGMSFRKKTTFYDFVYEQGGKKYIASNSNMPTYFVDDNNNKYIPFFTQEFFNASGVTAQDYNSFFPGVSFSGFNVVDASVKNEEILAENGMIHEVDKVILPLQSIDQYLSSKPEYSEFKKLIDENAFYLTYYKLQTRYKALTGSDDSVFVKLYGDMAFAPNNENYLSTFSSDAQANFFSIAVPTNDQLLAYKQHLLKDWGPELTPSMKRNLIDSHMWTRALWPSKFNVTINSKAERPTFTSGDVIEQKMLSNGNFYGINTVQEANVFRTVYSKPYLNRDYLLQTQGLNRSIINQITDPEAKYGLIMQSDDQYAAAGYSYSDLDANYRFTNPTTGATIINDVAKARFLRLLQMSVFDNSFLNLTDFAGKKGVLKGSIGEGDTEEYLYYDNNKLYASGNMDTNTPVTITKVEQTVNGPVFYTSGTLLFSEKKLGTTIKDLAALDYESYGYFYDYLRQSTIWNAESIIGITLGGEYTVLIPTNTAIKEAVMRGELPGNVVTGVPTTNPAGLLDKDNVARFLLYHFIEKETVAPDGDPDKQGRMTTAFKDLNASEPDTYVHVATQKDAMQITDNNVASPSANLNISSSNKLGDRSLIHSIDRVLLSK